jgi:hypothetical protein
MIISGKWVLADDPTQQANIPMDVLLPAIGVDTPIIPDEGLVIDTNINRFKDPITGNVLDPFPGRRKILRIPRTRGRVDNFPEADNPSRAINGHIHA